MMIDLLFLFIFICSASCRPNYNNPKTSTCGYATCHPTKQGVLNVHIVPHSHDDVGWLKTVDQYYYGSRTLTQRAGVQYILDSVIDELMKDPDRRFVYVESAFFDRWWSHQDDQRRHHVKRLVNEGRLEFAGGAWSMNDEATTHYQSIIDQMSWGLRMLNHTFGECGRPKVGWQIDPFGHSREMTNIWAQAGYDGLFLGRIDFQDKKNRFQKQEAEMIWRGSDDLGKSSDLFTGVLYNNYAPPPGFCFDVLCSDDPIIDDPRSPDYNVDKMVTKFVEYANNQSKTYKSDHIIMTMGEDFNYQDARMWYKNLDKLIKYVNNRDTTINLFYSTPSCYLKSLNEANLKWPTKQDDFFPYASDNHAFWTGYFTSRPTIKYFERRGNNFLQVCKQLYAMTNLNEKDKIDLNMLRSAMGIMQHHDAVTGTEQQHVARDYARLLDVGIDDCLTTTKESLNILMSNKNQKNRVPSSKSSKDIYMPMTLCQLNITECEVTESSKIFVITVYNPLAHIISDYVRLPVTANTYSIKDPSGENIDYEILSISNSVMEQLPSRKSNATGELLFLAENLLPMGYRSYYVQETNSENKMHLIQPTPKVITKKAQEDSVSSDEDDMMGDSTPMVIDSRSQGLSGFDIGMSEFKKLILKEIQEENSIENAHIKLALHPSNGLVDSITVNENGILTTLPICQQLMYYEGMPASNSTIYNRPSGAYIFRPKSEQAKFFDKPVNTVFKGAMVQEIHQKFSSWATQIIRLYKDNMHLEFEWLVGPIPIDDGVGKEIVSRFITNFKTDGEFYTDSNGRQMLKRIVNKRPTWDVQLDEKTSGNYYPVTSMICLKDKNTENELHVMTDRAQGGSSLKDGEIEIMVHRRLLYDDSFGVGEPLNETENGLGLVAKGTHYVIIGSSTHRDLPIPVTSRHLALKKLLQPSIFITPAENITFDQWKNNRNEFSGLHTALPANVHLLTLEPWKDGSILLRLEHILESKNDPQDLSKPAIVNLRNLFSEIKILTVRETMLGANQWKENSNRLKWQTSEETFNTNDNESPNDSKRKRKDKDDEFLITLNPMEIRTFILTANVL